MDSVDSRKMGALWYAFGRIDSGTAGQLDSTDAMRFADEQRVAREAYNRGEAGHLPSIQDAWALFAARAALKGA